MKQFFKMLFASCLGVILASGVVLFLFFGALGSLIGSIDESFSKDKKATKEKLSQESVLLLDLEGKISDTSTTNDLLDKLFSTSEDTKTYSLREITDGIDAAAQDPKVEAISLKLDKSTMGFASAQEIRNHLLKFKESGKKIFAFSDIYSFGNYYLSSVADSIYGNPQGVIDLNGLSSRILFTRGTMEKLGVKMEVFKVGTYKGAVEPFILDKLSDPNRMQLEEIFNGLWKGTTQEIALSRGLTQDSIQAIADKGLTFRPMSEQLKAKLVDHLIYETEYNDRVSMALLGDSTKKAKFVRLSDISPKKSEKDAQRIALIVASGAIVNVSSDSPVPNPFAQKTEQITPALIKQLRDLAEDESVKAVVMRVNSPGGDAFLSEKIYHEMQYLKSKKPVVVSMGDYAASGGYYISAPASEIIAQPTTLTGSIGIFGMFPNFTGTAEKIALKQDVVKTAKYADIGNPFRPLTSDERGLIQQNVNRGYDLFLSRVAEGRGMTKAQVDSVGQGRVWLGQKALELRLVDKLGGLQTAFEEAARLAEVEHYKVYLDEPERSLFEKLLLGKGFATAQYLQSWMMTPEEQQLQSLLQALRGQIGIVAVAPLPLSNITLTPQTSILQ